MNLKTTARTSQLKIDCRECGHRLRTLHGTPWLLEAVLVVIHNSHAGHALRTELPRGRARLAIACACGVSCVLHVPPHMLGLSAIAFHADGHEGHRMTIDVDGQRIYPPHEAPP